MKHSVLRKWYFMILKKRKSIKYILSKIKINKPIIYFVTNYVTANDCANICLAIGASPIMADEKLEAGEITQIADAIVINTGTLNQFTFDAMKIVCSVANQRHIPIILDPCGVGCSSFRNECIKTLITKYKFHAIRGNLSEIAFIQSMLSQDCNAIKHQNRGGVDSHITMNEKQKSQMAIQLAQQLSCVICISGKIDIITDGKNIQYCNAGKCQRTGAADEMAAKIRTGTIQLRGGRDGSVS